MCLLVVGHSERRRFKYIDLKKLSGRFGIQAALPQKMSRLQREQLATAVEISPIGLQFTGSAEGWKSATCSNTAKGDCREVAQSSSSLYCLMSKALGLESNAVPNKAIPAFPGID
jgi:hypothetical protein